MLTRTKRGRSVSSTAKPTQSLCSPSSPLPRFVLSRVRAKEAKRSSCFHVSITRPFPHCRTTSQEVSSDWGLVITDMASGKRWNEQIGGEERATQARTGSRSRPRTRSSKYPALGGEEGFFLGPLIGPLSTCCLFWLVGSFVFAPSHRVDGPV